LSAAVSVAELPRRIHELADDNARTRPDELAYIDHDGRCLCWSDFDAAVAVLVRRLREAGVRGGDRLLIINENCIAAAAAIMAASRLDAWAVLINARLAGPEIDRIKAHAKPRAVLATTDVSREAQDHATRYEAQPFSHPLLGRLGIAGNLEAEAEPVEAANDGQVAAMIYTSGTTGEPKGVMLTHANLLYVATVSGGLRRLGASDFVYGVLPISHVFGLSSMFLAAMRAGATLQFVPRFDPGHLAAALAGGVTVFQGVPAMYAKLLEWLDRQNKPLKAPKLRYMSAGGSPLDVDWKRQIETRFGTVLHNGYGLTEASPTISQTLVDRRTEDDSIGPVLPGLDVRLVDANGREVSDEGVGELWMRGPTVMKGYYRAPEATAATVTPDGWLRTGDLARQAPNGDLYLVGRAKELIIRSGFNVYPPEVETAINAHEAVVMSAVIGRPFQGNEEVIAFVEVAPGSDLTADALQAFLAARLAPYKRPQHIFIVPQMPAAATGKVKKHELLPLAERLIASQ